MLSLPRVYQNWRGIWMILNNTDGEIVWEFTTSQKVKKRMLMNLSSPSRPLQKKDKLDIELQDMDIDRTHRIGRASGKPRAILVKFTSYRARNILIKHRRKLKGSKISIHEDLTKSNQDLHMKTSKQFGVVSTWSQDGRVYASVMTSTPGKLAKVPIKSYASWQDLPDKRAYQEILETVTTKDIEMTKNESASREQYQGVLTRNRTGSLSKWEVRALAKWTWNSLFNCGLLYISSVKNIIITFHHFKRNWN